jgi:hypothetical protein
MQGKLPGTNPDVVRVDYNSGWLYCPSELFVQAGAVQRVS